MEDSQLKTVLQSIAVSSGSIPLSSPNDLQVAFGVLEQFKAFSRRIPVCLGWLHQEHHSIETTDITIPVKLYALTVLEKFLLKGYAQLQNESDRLTLRQAVMVACRQIAPHPISTPKIRILANKLASILAGLVVRDFPQRWTTFIQDVFSPCDQGGLWYDSSSGDAQIMGVKLCCECLQIVTEDCTDSDFNSKVRVPIVHVSTKYLTDSN